MKQQFPSGAQARKRVNQDAVPTAFPDRSGSIRSSLIDVVSDHQERLEKNAAARSSGTRPVTTGESLADAALYAISLSMVNLTLDVLVHNQFAQKIEWSAICSRFAVVLPAIGALYYVLHSSALLRLGLLRQACFLAFSCAAGCWLVRMTNVEPYMAVMRKAPPLGTLLVWAYIEMTLLFALASSAFIVAYIWIYEYPII